MLVREFVVGVVAFCVCACGGSSEQDLAGGGGAETSAGGQTVSSATSSNATSGISSAGTGGAGPAPNDECAGAIGIQLMADGVPAELDGSTATATDGHAPPCLDRTGSADVIFALELTEDCSLLIEVAPLDPAYDPAFTLQSACDGFTVTDYCLNNNAAAPETLAAGLGAGSYFLVVDGAQGSVGQFHLTVVCAPPACGDGLLNSSAGEECDDGNTVGDDGCSDTCFFEPQLQPFDDCSNAESEPPILIDQGQLLLAPSAAQFATTLGASDSGTPPCVSDGTPSPDHVAKIVPLVDGTLTATVGIDALFQDVCEMNGFVCGGGCFDLAIWATTDGCASAGNPVGCSADPEDAHSTETISFPVTAGQEYFVIVDGHQEPLGCSSGSYLLALELL